MNEKYKLFPKIALWSLSLLSVFVIIGYMVMIMTGNNEGTWEVAGEFLAIPKFTSGYLVWTYVLVAIAAIAFGVSMCVLVYHLFRKDPKKALMYLAIIVFYFGVVPAICFGLATGDAVEIIGYEGTDNVGYWARLSEGMLYWTYFAVVSTLIAMGCGIVYKSLKK
jgi:hypothetical protein